MAGCNPCNRDFELELSDHEGEHPSRRVRVKATRASQHGTPAPTTPATPTTPAVAPLPPNVKRRSREYSGSYGNFKGTYKSTDEGPPDSGSRPAQQSTPAPPQAVGQQTEPGPDEVHHHRTHSHRHRHSHAHSHDSDNGEQQHSGSHSQNGLNFFLELLGRAFVTWDLLNTLTGGSNHREGGNSHREAPAWENILRTVTEVIGEEDSRPSTPPRQSSHRGGHARDYESDR